MEKKKINPMYISEDGTYELTGDERKLRDEVNYIYIFIGSVIIGRVVSGGIIFLATLIIRFMEKQIISGNLYF